MPMEDWTKEKNYEDVGETGDLEMKTQFVGIVQQQFVLPKLEDFGDWLRLIGVTAWICRLKSNLETQEKKNGPLLLKEIRYAEKLWIKKCQVECFEEELSLLRTEKSVVKNSKIFHLFSMLKEEIIVVGRRLIKSPNLTEEAKYPPILESKHPWTKLLVESYHRDLGHHGLEMISNELRKRYWIMGLRLAVKDASKKCQKCREDRGKAVLPQMAVLPDFRVTRPSRPFTYVGVDYFWPLEVNILRRKVKRWGALFTCLSTRAVHLEIAYSLSTDGILMALERFICRRGEPVEIWSDNGTNFKEADQELKKSLQEMDQEKIQDKMSTRKIIWNFIPPGAPHMGGAWEWLDRSVKQAMITILKNRSLTDELLQTVFAEAKVTVNSRPLTCVSMDKDDEEAITPNSFLIISTSVKQPPGNFSDTDLSLRKKWRIIFGKDELRNTFHHYPYGRSGESQFRMSRLEN